METILSYLDNMFLSMPQTPEVLRAKEELSSMMEDKYNELIAEGKKENEAIGIVISEFGDLKELKEGLGLADGSSRAGESYGASQSYGETQNYGASQSYGKNADYGTMPRMVSRQDAEEYMAVSAKTSKWIAFGVLLCIWSPIFLFVCGGIDDAVKKLSDGAIIIFGLVPLLVLIGIAVAVFIYNGMKMEKFEYLKKERIQIDGALERELSQIAEEEKPKATVKLIIGVVMCIFSVIPLLVGGGVSDNDMVHVLTLCFMLMVIGIAVAIIIAGQNRMECIKVLCQEGDFSVNHKKSNKITDIIAGIYWPIVAVIYLGWSFYTMNWGFTWIVWPIAGVLFGAIAAICAVVGEVKDRGAE